MTIDPLRGPGELCAYYDQPGHTPDQRPDPLAYLGHDPDEWPLCRSCTAAAGRPLDDQADAVSDIPAEHFEGCHPADEHAPETPEGHTPQDTEECWHDGTPTAHGCNCPDCWDQADYVPPSAVYHCRTCGRWWAYMTGINVIKITF